MNTDDFPSARSEDWTAQQISLALFNRARMTPRLGEYVPIDMAALELEARFVTDCRREVAPLLDAVPAGTGAFVAWFERLADHGPGQGDPLFPWLRDKADLDDMRWFLHQEVAGEAGFEDLLALTQMKMPDRPKLEMARNYWDEMGRGEARGMHGPMLARLAHELKLAPDVYNVLPESLALGNLMTALAHNRQFAYHAVGALGVIEMTAPGRAACVAEGLRRLGISGKARHYFALHAVLDQRHSAAWNAEVIAPLVAEDPRRAHCIGEGALMRLRRGEACFQAYREYFGARMGVRTRLPAMRRDHALAEV